MPDLYGMLQPLLAKMAPRPEEDPESMGLPFQSTTGVNVGTTEKYDPQPPAPPPDMGGLPFASTTGVSKGTTVSALSPQQPQADTLNIGLPFQSTTGVSKGTTVSALGGGNITATSSPRTVSPQAKGDTTSLMQALGSNPPDIAAMQGGMSGGGDISAVPSAAPTSDRVELAPGIWGSRSGAPVGLPSGVPAGAGGMPNELPLPQGPSPFSLMGKTPPDVAALGGGPKPSAPPAAGGRGIDLAGLQVEEGDAGDAYRKEHYRQHVERFPDGTPVITGTGTPDEHKGFWNRFKHALQGMGLGALSAMNSADPRDPNALMRALGGAIGGGATAGWNPQNADNLYNRVLVDPEADRLRQKQLINQKIKMEQEEHQNKILDMENLRKSREAQVTQGQAQTDINRRRIDLDERLDPERIKVEREKIEAQERERAATTDIARRNISHPPGHLYFDEQGQPRIAPYSPAQLGELKGSGTNSQQWTQYVANTGTPEQRVAQKLVEQPPSPNDIIAYSVRNNMLGGVPPATGQQYMEILQALRENSPINRNDPTKALTYGGGKTASEDEIGAAQEYFTKADAFFRSKLKEQFIAQDQQVRQQLFGQQQQGGAGPPQPPQPGARPGTNASNEGGIKKNIKDLVK